MTEDYLTIEQVLSISRTDIDSHIKSGTFTGLDGTTDDDQENFYTIESLYIQWLDPTKKIMGENKLWVMFEEEYPTYLN